MNILSRNDANPKAAPAPNPTVKGLYILALTAEILSPDTLKSVVQIGDDMLREKNRAFAHLLGEQMHPDTPIIVANILFAGALMHTLQTMQAALIGWLEVQHNVECTPAINHSFFPHGMRDPQDRENFLLYYFDMEGQLPSNPRKITLSAPVSI